MNEHLRRFVKFIHAAAQPHSANAWHSLRKQAHRPGIDVSLKRPWQKQETHEMTTCILRLASEAAAAAERYRQAHGQTPKATDDAITALLSAIVTMEVTGPLAVEAVSDGGAMIRYLQECITAYRSRN